MGRILAIDYGRKRCGVAVTDILQISANGLPTVRTCDLLDFIAQYLSKEEVDKIIIGDPKDMSGNPSENKQYIVPFVNRIKKLYPHIPVEWVDERFTSVIAHRELIAGGFKKKERQEKGRTDEISAVLILTTYLETKLNN